MKGLAFKDSVDFISLSVRIAVQGQLWERNLSKGFERAITNCRWKMKLWKRFMKTDLELNSVMRHFWNSTAFLGPGEKGWERVEYWILFASRHIRLYSCEIHCTLGIVVVGNAWGFPSLPLSGGFEYKSLQGYKKPSGKEAVKANHWNKIEVIMKC